MTIHNFHTPLLALYYIIHTDVVTEQSSTDLVQVQAFELCTGVT